MEVVKTSSADLLVSVLLDPTKNSCIGRAESVGQLHLQRAGIYGKTHNMRLPIIGDRVVVVLCGAPSETSKNGHCDPPLDQNLPDQVGRVLFQWYLAIAGLVSGQSLTNYQIGFSFFPSPMNTNTTIKVLRHQNR